VVTADEVEDPQPRDGETDTALGEHTEGVGPAVTQRRDHASQ